MKQPCQGELMSILAYSKAPTNDEDEAKVDSPLRKTHKI
jgi:hypothetical protein